jgi:hypothetical protein
LFTAFYWKGKYHPVPEKFTFSNMTVKLMWDMWHHGDEAQKIFPYRKFCKGDLQTESQKVNLVRARKVMNVIFELANVIGAVPDNVTMENLVNNRSRNISQNIFQAGFAHLKELISVIIPHSAATRRWDELQYTTIYKDIVATELDQI